MIPEIHFWEAVIEMFARITCTVSAKTIHIGSLLHLQLTTTFHFQFISHLFPTYFNSVICSMLSVIASTSSHSSTLCGRVCEQMNRMFMCECQISAFYLHSCGCDVAHKVYSSNWRVPWKCSVIWKIVFLTFKNKS